MDDDERLRDLVKTTIAVAFARHESIWSGELYHQLVDAGEAVPEDKLADILEELRQQGYVRLAHSTAGSTQFREHGAVGIRPGKRYDEL